MSEPTLTDNTDEHRFEVAIDGTAAGFTQYRDAAGIRTFPHTEVKDEFGGRGLGRDVIRFGLDATRRQGLQVVPLCPAVAGFIRKNPDYLDLVPQDRRAEFDLA